MSAAIGVGRRATVARLRGDGAVAGFHVGAAVAFIGADAPEAWVAGGGAVAARGMG